MYGVVKVWQETLTLPTWTTGNEDSNPMFLENVFIKDRPERCIPMALWIR